MTYHHLPSGEGPNYAWENDQPFVKVSAAETGGAYTLIEDNLKASFALGLHRHDQHAETFYILEGALDFYLDGDWIRAEPGATLHVPPGLPHACRVADGVPAKMLMIMQPSGFDGFLAELADSPTPTSSSSGWSANAVARSRNSSTRSLARRGSGARSSLRPRPIIHR